MILYHLMREYLQAIIDEPWRPIGRASLLAWIAFYLVFLIYAFHADGAGLIIDSANLVVHEGGHNLFGWFGPTLGLWGGTLLQWLVPFLLAIYFFSQRQIPGFVFSLFFLRELALHRHLHGRCPRPGVTAGDDRRS